MVRKPFLLCIASLVFVAATASAQPSYFPSGPQQDVPESTVTSGGWTECHTDTYADEGEDLSDLLDACPGTHMMLACRPVEADNFTLLAAALRSDVLTDTGENEIDTTNSNGSEWYFSNSWGSMGFANGSDSVEKDDCDTANINGDLRLCWHLGEDTIRVGYRCGNDTEDPGDLNENPDWERVILVSAAAVPTVSPWQLVILAVLIVTLALVSLKLRRVREG
jgi:hypothetical protein